MALTLSDDDLAAITSIVLSQVTSVATSLSTVNSIATTTRTLASTAASVATSTSGGVSTNTSIVTTVSTGLSTTTSIATKTSTGVSTVTSIVTTISTAISGLATLDEQADALWAHETRTITQTGATLAAAVAGGLVTIQRGDSFSATFTGLSDSTNHSKLWFTVKRNLDDADAAAIIQIDHATGLLYLNATAVPAARNANGTLTLPNTASATVTLDEVETDDLVPAEGLYWDLQMLDTGGTVTTLTSGPCNIVADVSRIVV